MAVTAFIYGKAFEHISGDSFEANDMRCALVGSGYAPDQDAHEYFSSVVANEISGTGYTAGGVALASKVISYTAGTNVLKFTCANPSWAAATVTARYAMFYDRTPGADASRPLLVCVDFGEDKGVIGGTFTVTIDAAGLLTQTMAA